jgi:hypothetical protein
MISLWSQSTKYPSSHFIHHDLALVTFLRALLLVNSFLMALCSGIFHYSDPLFQGTLKDPPAWHFIVITKLGVEAAPVREN